MNPAPLKTLILLLACAATLVCHPAFPAPTLVLNSFYSSPLTSPEKDGFLDLLYQELALRTGIPIEIQSLPGERALMNANSGVNDGDVSRIAGLEKQYPNLVMVPEQDIHLQMAVFTRNADFTMTGLASLQPYDVGIVTGWKILERSIVGTHSRMTVATGEQLFMMLDSNHIDIAVIERIQGRQMIRRMALKNIRELQPAFLATDYYLYLNKKHADLVPILAAELKKMKADGTSQRLYKDVMDHYAE